MSRLTILLLLTALASVIESKEVQKKLISIALTEDDIVLGDDDLARANAAEQEIGFIGDLIIGQRRPDETIYRRTVRVTNHENHVGFFAMELAANTGVVHFASIRNNRESRAVVCDTPYTLGTPISSFIVRVLPRSDTVLSVFVATHPER